MIHALLITVSVLAAPTENVAALPTGLNLDTIRALPMQHDGRWPPLDTVARDIVEEVTGDPFYRGHDPVAWLLAWTFDPATWMHQPLITISNAELRRELKLPEAQTVFSYMDLARHNHFRHLVGQLREIPQGRKMNPLESKVADINAKLGRLDEAFGGGSLRMVPHPTDAKGAWSGIPKDVATATEPVKSFAAAWSELGDSFLRDDMLAFGKASQQVVSRAAALPAAYSPPQSLIRTELHYNAIHPFRTAWIVMVAGAVLAGGAMLVKRRWFDVLALLGLVAGFALLSYGLWLRWNIAGRIPASNMFESLLFLSWGMGAFAILAKFLLPHRIVPLTASAMGALALLLADCLPMNHYIRPIPPVLADTIWMSIHVPVIMVSYSVLALGVFFAHLQLIAMAAAPKRTKFATTIDNLHYWYINVGSILLLTGIVTGSMWAASSWGRYWGWDPKEVWSLVALLGYLAILHVRIDRDRVPRGGYLIALIMMVALFIIVLPKLGPMTAISATAFGATAMAMVFFVVTRGAFATALKSIICFWLIIMTYVGVNYVLGIGLHSYGFGTGAMARYMLLFGSLDLGFAILLSVIYVWRRQSFSNAAPRGIALQVG